jgi:hypothetical protein
MALQALCTLSQRGEFLRLGLSEAKAELICSKYNVTSLGAQPALLAYLSSAVDVQTAQSKNQSESINVMFLLFSAYLVFIM